MSGSKTVFKSLYRNILKHARVLDFHPINKCFLVSKPSKLFLREYDSYVNVKLSSSDIDLVERILNDFNQGEYYLPSPAFTPPHSIQTAIKTVFRDGIPARFFNKYYTHRAEIENNPNKQLQLSFYLLKRLSNCTHLISKIPSEKRKHMYHSLKKNNKNTILKKKSPSSSSSSSSSSSDNILDFKPDNTITLDSLQLLRREHLFTDHHSMRGSLLVTHPMSCVNQDDLNRRVLYIIESTKNQVVGIVLNNAYQSFHSRPHKFNHSNPEKTNQTITPLGNPKRRIQDSASAYSGWSGEFNYLGGPVKDEKFPAFIMHNCELFYEKFKEHSIELLEESKEEEEEVDDDGKTRKGKGKRNGRVYWTWMMQENEERILNELSSISALFNQTASDMAGTGENYLGSDAKLHEYYEYIRKESKDGPGMVFKFFQQYAVWSPVQLKIELENNSWFPVKLGCRKEEYQLLMNRCPTPKVKRDFCRMHHRKAKGKEVEMIEEEEEEGEEGKRRVSSNTSHGVKKTTLQHVRKAYNSWMWQMFLSKLGNEYYAMSVFPEFTKEFKMDYHRFIAEFQESWIAEDRKDYGMYMEEDDGEDTADYSESSSGEDSETEEIQKPRFIG